MHVVKGGARFLLATSAFALATTSIATETTTYRYDALGRLVETSASGGPASGKTTTIAYDPAGNRSSYTVSSAGSAPTITIANTSVAEGGQLVFTLTKTGNAAASVWWTYLEGSALGGTDFTPADGFISFAAGETTKTITIQTLTDSVVEPNEHMAVVLYNPSGATVPNDRAYGTITDAAPAAPTISIANTSAAEGSPLVFTLTKTGNAAASVWWTYLDGSAAGGSDFTPSSGFVSFAAGETTKTISVPTLTDSIVEPSENMAVVLYNPTGAALPNDRAYGTITDAPPPPPATPTITIANTSAAEGSPLVFTLTKTGSAAASVWWTYLEGSALGGTDFTPADGFISFAAGETTKTIIIQTLTDSVVEPNENMAVVLYSPSGATVPNDRAYGTITDGSSPPPPPPPPPANQSPVAVNDSGTTSKCVAASFPVLANDYDPDGNTPLALVSASSQGVPGDATVVGNSVQFTPHGTEGQAIVTYTMRDSLGATASATLTISISEGFCGGGGNQSSASSAPTVPDEPGPEGGP